MPKSPTNRRTVAEDWIPPKLLRLARRARPSSASGVTRTATTGSAAHAPPTGAERAPTDPRWRTLTERSLAGLAACDPAYRPTTFWTPGVERLLDEMETQGLERFKAWPQAFKWFYPTYGSRLRGEEIRELVKATTALNPRVNVAWLRRALNATPDARRDFDAARLAWNHDNWPIDLESHGESEVGRPIQRYALTGHDGPRWGKPYLNYLLCMAALSQHVTAPPKSFLELGGGFGVLGELLMSRDPEARYVNADIPPLLTVASYYLSTLFGEDRVLTYDARVPDSGSISVPRSACLPNWRIADVEGPFDVFVNSFSFQEMEPAVVENYLDTVAALGVRYVVSLNSRDGKSVATSEGQFGVTEQVTSARIIAMLQARGYELCATYNRPLLVASGELAVLRRL